MPRRKANSTTTIDKAERDADIIKLYVAGEPLDSLCSATGLSRARIYQILRRAGVPRVRQPAASDRDAFLGVNISEPVKEALREEALRRGVSVSALSSDVLKEMLIACGYPLEAEKVC